MKKILFITPYVPYPLNSGGNQAFFNMVDYLRHKMEVSILLFPQRHSQKQDIENLKTIWNNVTFYIFTATPPEVDCPRYYWLLKKIKDSATRKMRRIRTRANKEKDMAREKSLLPKSYFQPLPIQYMEYVSNICSGFDIVQVEFYELISLGYLFPPTVNSVFVHHEIRYIHNENEIPLFKNQTNIDRLYFNVSKDFERLALQQFKHIIALTETDKHILQKFLDREEGIYASPAVIKITNDTSVEFKPTNNRLTFVGSEDHYPNLDAVCWFIKEIAPILRAQNFKFTFQVIGTWKSKHIKELQSLCPEMELTGFVEDLNSFLNGSIFLVPIRIGSGMRMKILDGIIAKAPIITTSKGVEGMDFANQKECFIRDSAKDFADAIIRLVKDTVLQRNIALQAHQKLYSTYNIDNMLEKRMKIYNDILSDKN